MKKQIRKTISYSNLPIPVPGKWTTICFIILKITNWPWWANLMIFLWVSFLWVIFLVRLLVFKEEYINIFEEKVL